MASDLVVVGRRALEANEQRFFGPWVGVSPTLGAVNGGGPPIGRPIIVVLVMVAKLHPFNGGAASSLKVHDLD